MEAQLNCKYLFAIALTALVSCSRQELSDISRENLSERTISLNASISESSRTSLDGLSVSWEKNDKIEVFSSADMYPAVFNLESGEGTPAAVFSGSLAGVPDIAKYPFNSEDRYLNGYISTALPYEQEYIAGNFATGISPMVAVPDKNGDLNFRNLCSVVRLTLTGSSTLTGISLTTEDEDCYLAGPAKIRIEGGVPTLSIEPTVSTKLTIITEGQGFPTINLLCNSVKLSPMIRKTFCFIVPAQVYESGLVIDVQTEVGSFRKQTGRLDLKSSTLYDIEPLDVVINGNLEPSGFLKGSGNESSPYLISSVEDLLHVQNAMSAKGKITNEDGSQGTAAKSAWYLLTKDLDLSVCCGPQVGNWKPLTVNKNWFTGHFDGGGHKITGVFCSSGSTDNNSFFGDIYSGGYLGNLEVEGNISGGIASVVFTSNYGTVENCIARGTSAAHGNYWAGGVAASNYGTMRNCINYAEVSVDATIYVATGGIASSSNGGDIYDCVNYGKILSNTGNCMSGGITGRMQEATIANCVNYGDITGMDYSAGIVGKMFSTDVISCVNYGDIHGFDSGTTLCAGICAEFYDPFSQKTGSISNCINVGNVSGGKYNYGICARNVLTVQYCYWLYDSAAGVGLSNGVAGGTRTGIASLTTAQMKGTSASSSLYGGYTDPVDALNSYGFNKSTSTLTLQGWMYDSKTGWPCMTGRPALPPGQSDKFIKINTSSLTLNTLEQSFDVIVTSSAEVSVTLPDWISQKGVKKDVNGTIHYTQFTFGVLQNKTGSERTSDITVTGTDGCSDTFKVTQRYTYISDDYSRNGNVVTLQKASEGSGIDIVLMGDAYTDVDIKNGTYESDIRRGVEAFFSVEPYASFRNLFNIYYVELVSSSNVIGESTALSTYFGSGTLVGGNDSKVRNLCNSVTKKSNMDDVTAIVIINSKQYAGTCYMYYSDIGDHGLGFSISYFPLGTASSGQTSMEALIRHEAAGHGFGKLADEYSYQSMGTIPDSEINDYRYLQGFGWWPNVDFTDDPFAVKWTKYIQDNRYASEQISVFEGGATYWSGVWRPTLNSIMRFNTGQFNAPSRQAIYYKIHRLAYGSSWKYDHETFVSYDAVSRNAAAKVSSAPSASEIESFRPTHPPVIVR